MRSREKHWPSVWPFIKTLTSKKAARLVKIAEEECPVFSQFSYIRLYRCHPFAYHFRQEKRDLLFVHSDTFIRMIFLESVVKSSLERFAFQMYRSSSQLHRRVWCWSLFHLPSVETMWSSMRAVKMKLDLLGVRWGLTRLAVLVQINLQWFNVFFETERAHCPKQIVSVDRFTLFALAFVTRFACYKADELGDALLNSFFCVFRYLRICWQSFFHYSADVCDWKKPILFANVPTLLFVIVIDIRFVGVAHAFFSLMWSVARPGKLSPLPFESDFNSDLKNKTWISFISLPSYEMNETFIIFIIFYFFLFGMLICITFEGTKVVFSLKSGINELCGAHPSRDRRIARFSARASCQGDGWTARQDARGVCASQYPSTRFSRPWTYLGKFHFR